MTDRTAAPERLRAEGLQRLAEALRSDGFDSLSTEEHALSTRWPVFVRSLPRGEARVALSSFVDADRRGGSAWVVTAYVGWADAEVEQVLSEALTAASQPALDARWASFTAPLSGIGPGGNLRSATPLEIRDAAQVGPWADDVRADVARDLPAWLGHFNDVSGVLTYAKRWPLFNDYGHQLSGLIVACLSGLHDEIDYFARFIFKQTARAMLRHDEYDLFARTYAAIGMVTDTDVPVPTLAEVEQWAADQQRRKKY